MRLFLAAAALLALTPAPSLAQLPAALEAALSTNPREAAPTGLDFRLEEGGEGITVRVDLSGEDVRYRLLQPSEADLSETQQEMWDGFLDPEEDAFRDTDDPDAGEGLTGPVSLRRMVGDEARHLRDEGGLAIYGFAPQSMAVGADVDDGEGDAQMDAMLRHLNGEIALDASGHVAWVHLFAAESFKPNMAARINTFSMRQSFVFEPAYAAPRLSRLEMALSGSAAFQSFEQSMAMEISNLVFDGGDAQSGDLGAAAESP
ncbi:MAG: hypothetical protein ACFE0P_00625 [Oceanicaulis sp.]